MSELSWTNAEELCVEGKAWTDTKESYHRLPAHAEKVVRDVIWDLSQKTTGITVRFTSNSKEIHARWTLGGEPLSAHHTNIVAYSGLDLYARTPAGTWHWIGMSRTVPGVIAEWNLTDWGELDGEEHEFKIYLPLYNSVKKLEIGTTVGSQISTVSARPEKPIAYYGTSIVHGAGVSRPGMSHASILARRLDYPIFNLGFSGNAIMEPEMAEFFCELDPAVYLLDTLPNMDATSIEERAEHFIRTLSKAHPATPIILVEDRTYPASWLMPEPAKRNVESRAAFKKVYGRLLSDLPTPLHYIEGDGLLGIDSDGSNDGSHCNDLGASRMSDALEPVLRRVLGLVGY